MASASVSFALPALVGVPLSKQVTQAVYDETCSSCVLLLVQLQLADPAEWDTRGQKQETPETRNPASLLNIKSVEICMDTTR